MNQGARDANALQERRIREDHEQTIIKLLEKILDLLTWYCRDDPKPPAYGKN